MKDNLSQREIAKIEKRKLTLYLGLNQDHKLGKEEKKFISHYLDKFVKISGQK